MSAIGGHDRPTASNLNFVPGQTVANSFIAQIGADRTVCLYMDVRIRWRNRVSPITWCRSRPASSG